MKNGKEIKLYNILFPIWFLLLIPTAWVAILPFNFIVDSLVILLAMKIIGINSKWKMYKRSILKVWIFGFISDIIGSLVMLGALYVNDGIRGDELYLTIPAVMIAAIFIFIFNYFISFKYCDRREKFIMSICLAVMTAPYTFMIPLNWIYY